VTSLVAPATVAGVAIGFGAQRVVGDLLSGFFLLSEDQYGVGDVVQIAQPNQLVGTGTVEAVSLRTTRLHTATGELVIIPNEAILQVVNRSREWSRVIVDVPVELEADIDRAADALRAVGAEMAADEGWTELLLEAPTVTGVESIEVGYANLRIVARTLPAKAPRSTASCGAAPSAPCARRAWRRPVPAHDRPHSSSVIHRGRCRWPSSRSSSSTSRCARPRFLRLPTCRWRRYRLPVQRRQRCPYDEHHR
jgi:small-conductance mechanosensitive channel